MTARYALPAVLGGQEFDGEAHGDGVILDVPGYGNLLMPAHYVTQVMQPPPPEPPNGTVRSDGANVAIRCDDPDDGDGRSRWWRDGIEGSDEWAAVAPIVFGPGWREYVPDPADDAPALPFTAWDTDAESQVVLVEPSNAYADRLFVEVDPTHLDRKHVRQLAAALWAWAAREVEQP